MKKQKEKSVKKAVSKRGSEKSTTKNSSQKGKLLNELKSLIKDIDEQSLSFLIRQTRTILHNMQVEKVNKELTRLEAIDQKIKKTARSKTTSQPAISAVEIEESEDGKHFIMIIKNSRKFLTRAEMREIVHICHAAENAEQASPRLYRWFSRNRTDVLADAQISGQNDPYLAETYKLLISRYKTAE